MQYRVGLDKQDLCARDMLEIVEKRWIRVFKSDVEALKQLPNTQYTERLIKGWLAQIRRCKHRRAAMRKLVAMKPIMAGEGLFKCRCGVYLDQARPNYCPYCGQRLRWDK